MAEKVTDGGREGEKVESKEQEAKFLRDMDRESRATEPFAIPSPMREPKPAKKSRKKCCLWCCGITTGVVLLVIVILIILAFTVFKPRDPELRVDSVTLDSITIDINGLLTTFNPSVDVSLQTKVSVKNPNYASFKYRNTTAYIYYHGKEIGDSSIAAGKINSRGTAKLDVPVEVRITGDVFSSNLTTDINSGIFPVATRVEIRGTANFLGFIKLKNARSNSYCEMEIFISNATLKDIDCKNKLKI